MNIHITFILLYPLNSIISIYLFYLYRKKTVIIIDIKKLVYDYGTSFIFEKINNESDLQLKVLFYGSKISYILSIIFFIAAIFTVNNTLD
jgi:hypothetical protein